MSSDRPKRSLHPKHERAERRLAADWVPKTGTRIRLASLDIEVGVTRKVMAAQIMKTLTDKDLEAWAKTEHRLVAEPPMAVA
jgi:hypothetical protein